MRAGLMPPAGAPRPDKATHDAFATWLEAELDRYAAARRIPAVQSLPSPEPGRVSERGSRHPRSRRRRRVAASGRRRELRVRQHRGRAEDVADADGALSGGGAEGQSIGRWTAAAGPEHRLLPDHRRPVAGRAAAWTAARHSRRHADPLHVPMDGDYEISPRLTRDLNESVPLYTEEQQLEISIDGERVGLFTLPGVGGPLPARHPPRMRSRNPTPRRRTRHRHGIGSASPEPRAPVQRARRSPRARRSRRSSRPFAPGPASARRATAQTNRGTCACR